MRRSEPQHEPQHQPAWYFFLLPLRWTGDLVSRVGNNDKMQAKQRLIFLWDVLRSLVILSLIAIFGTCPRISTTYRRHSVLTYIHESGPEPLSMQPSVQKLFVHKRQRISPNLDTGKIQILFWQTPFYKRVTLSQAAINNDDKDGFRAFSSGHFGNHVSLSITSPLAHRYSRELWSNAGTTTWYYFRSLLRIYGPR